MRDRTHTSRVWRTAPTCCRDAGSQGAGRLGAGSAAPPGSYFVRCPSQGPEPNGPPAPRVAAVNARAHAGSVAVQAALSARPLMPIRAHSRERGVAVGDAPTPWVRTARTGDTGDTGITDSTAHTGGCAHARR